MWGVRNIYPYTRAPAFKEFCVLLMQELKLVDWKIAPSPLMGLGLAKISGDVHVNKASRLYESAVQTWILDARISVAIEWTPVFS